MTLPLILLTILAPVAFVFAAFIPNDKAADGLAALALLGAVIALGAWAMLGFRWVKYSWDERACEEFGVEAGVETKLVDYHRWSWECLVLDDGFGWVPKSNYRNTP